MQYKEHFDVIVIGGGHAGTEAALAASRMGANTLLLTQNIETLGQMSCNPAIGGIGKGHLVKEISAMGGAMGVAADAAGIHFKILNQSKGEAVQATRAQADRRLYKQAIRQMLENADNLKIFQQEAAQLLLTQERACGIRVKTGIEFFGKTIILTAGTFLAGKICVGDIAYTGGRAGDPAASELAETLRTLPFRVGRLKTGTPARLDGRTIDFSRLEAQMGLDPCPYFSFWQEPGKIPQRACYITRTTAKTHAIIRDSIHLSSMFSGVIEGVGPRYCPSIEDKINRFSERDSHQIFLEPEGLDVNEYYPNGISTSLPFSVQYEFIHTIPGLENVHITRPGYAIEYDFFDPRDLQPTLETKLIENLFFAGQINGTTGYEEAAAQGLVAGINAALKASNKPLWYPERHEAYIGVLIDDLITCGTQEPYRMFTSRAEFRLLLREENADLRLSPKAHELGLIGANEYKIYQEKVRLIEQEKSKLNNIIILPGSLAAQKLQVEYGIEISAAIKALELLKRPNMDYFKLSELVAGESMDNYNNAMPQFAAVGRHIAIEVKYAGYIARQQDEVDKQKRLEDLTLPVTLDYDLIYGLSTEVRQKLKATRPTTLGQAQRIPGVTPAAISLIMVHLKSKKPKQE